MNKKYYLFLDDMRDISDVTWVNLPNVSWTVVRNYKEFRDAIWNKGIPEFVAYDHDLSDCHYGHGLNNDQIPYESYTEKTGYDCAKFLCNECMKLNVKHPDFVVHSMNPIGADNIRAYIKQYNKLVE